MRTREQILSVGIDRGGFEDLVSTIREKIADSKRGYVCFANVHTLYLASRDPGLSRALDTALRVLPDGMPLARWLSRTGSFQERVEGMSAFPMLLDVASREGIPVAFFGADESTLAALCTKAREQLPRLEVVASIAPEMGEIPFPSDAVSIVRLRESGAKLVFVALGCPKQERWMALHAESIPAAMVGVGNAFRTWLGWEKRPPSWVRRASMEWIFRLIQDPTRLWRRYLVSNSWFLANLVCRFFRGEFARTRRPSRW
jgi:N-acetylglucosaminyldiphosphoundecaprenol N-acetyl-beta-D-mannosaminyltransferase